MRKISVTIITFNEAVNLARALRSVAAISDDIIVVDYVDAAKKETYIIKRVIGIGGDHIDIKDNQVYLNGKLLEEDYINGVMTNNEDMSIDIPEGKVFVMGDNRSVSLDSRSFGPIEISSIIGRAVLVYWPLNHFQTLLAYSGENP